MSSVQNIRTAIKNRIAATIPTYTEAKYSLDFERNSSTDINNKYGVVPQGQEQVEGTNRFITLDQSFDIKLGKTFITDNAGDASLIALTETMMADMDTLYSDFITSRLGLPAVILNVFNKIILEPEYNTAEKYITITMSVTVKYRVAA